MDANTLHRKISFDAELRRQDIELKILSIKDEMKAILSALTESLDALQREEMHPEHAESLATQCTDAASMLNAVAGMMRAFEETRIARDVVHQIMEENQ